MFVLTLLAESQVHTRVTLTSIRAPLGPLSSLSGYMPSTLVIRKQDLFDHRYFVTDVIDRWGPVAWIIISEVFPLGLRAKGVSIGGSSNWLNNVRR